MCRKHENELCALAEEAAKLLLQTWELRNLSILAFDVLDAEDRLRNFWPYPILFIGEWLGSDQSGSK